jgi:hypothetical protein
MKTQTIRLADVFIIGPTMIFGGSKLTKEYPVVGRSLIAMGIGTIIYNWMNYEKARR